MASLGQRIRQMRKHLKLTQEGVCAKTGISKSFLSDVENGKRNISTSNLLDIARALGVSCDFLLLGEQGQGNGQESLPASFLAFGDAQNLYFRALQALFGMYLQFLSFRAWERESGAEHVDWESLYRGVIGHHERC
jgi:transcriptional regulator with XRE-family HTH domain